MVRSLEERAAAMTATVDAAVQTLVSPGFEPEDRVESPVVKYKRDIGKWCCLLCQRQFATETVLAHHLNGGAHLRKLAQAEISGRIKGGAAAATGKDDREGGSGGGGSGVKAGPLGSGPASGGPSPLLPRGPSPSLRQRLREGHELQPSEEREVAAALGVADPEVELAARAWRAELQLQAHKGGPMVRQLGVSPHVSPKARRPRPRSEATHEGNESNASNELAPLTPLTPLTPRTVRACRRTGVVPAELSPLPLAAFDIPSWDDSGEAERAEVRLLHTIRYDTRGRDLLYLGAYTAHSCYFSTCSTCFTCSTCSTCYAQVRILMHTMHEAERLAVRGAVAREASTRGLVRRSGAQSRAQRLRDGGLGPGAAEVSQHEARAEEEAARRRQVGEEQGLLAALQSQVRGRGRGRGRGRDRLEPGAAEPG